MSMESVRRYPALPIYKIRSRPPLRRNRVFVTRMTAGNATSPTSEYTFKTSETVTVVE